MEEDFFGYDTALPAFGTGKYADGDTREEDPLEDFDEFNDETFGDTLEGDWEKTHETLEESFRECKINNDSGFGQDARRTNEEGRSISHMVEYGVINDGEDDTLHARHAFEDLDPAVMGSSQSSEGRPIPGRRQQSLDELFGPSSPPAFLGTEQLVSPGKQNIWGSPMRESPVTRTSENGLKALLHQLQSAKPPIGSAAFHDPSIVTVGTSLPSVKTLEEIERELVTSHAKPFMLEEIEGQIRGNSLPNVLQDQIRRSSSPSVNQGTPLSVGTPPPAAHAQVANRALQQAMGGRTSPAQGTPQGRNSPMQQMGMGSSPPVHPMGMTPPDGRRGPPGGPFMHPRMMSPYRNINPRMLAQMSPQQLHMYAQMAGQQHHTPGPHNLQHTPGPRHQNQGPRTPGPGQRTPGPRQGGRNSPPGHHPPMGSSPVHPRIPMPMPYSDPSHMRGRRPHQNQPRHPLMQNQQRRPHPQQQQQMYQQQQEQYHNRRNYNNHRNYNNGGDYDHGYHGDQGYNGDGFRGERDEDAGLMTKKEKDWVIKIQLMQLQTDNPYLDDYYYSTLMMRLKMEEVRKLEQERGSGDAQEPKLVLPQFSKVETRTYRPAQFEGSLGKLTAASVHNPRQIIDKISRGNSLEGEDQKARNIRRFKELLLDIEKLYDRLLYIDDIEKRVLALPEEGRIPLLDERKENIDSIYNNLQRGGDFMTRLLGVRKGRLLIARALPLLQQCESSAVIASVLRGVSDVNNRDQGDKSWCKLFAPVEGTLKHCDLETLANYAGCLLENISTTQSNTTHALLQHKFGWSAVCCMLHRGEMVYSQDSMLLDKTKLNKWSEFVSHIATSILGLKEADLQVPITTYRDKNIPRHLERLADAKTVLHIETKLEVLSM
ncbi:unnamed protein product [Owenia fusiformis]|uniref:Uncharacterized protein n=1 Tax=Owenia fusiformis TaxID=6347 RepID=A0A8S4Q1Z4_OWEFU|nr:unnamed protein product [Owenia fusiformis]